MTTERNKIKTALEKSEAGKSLSETYRWGQFRKDETDEQWMGILGSTGRVDSHMRLFSKYTRAFAAMENGRFTEEAKEIFLDGIDNHDIGEAKINGMGIGDISAQIKTSADEKKESVMARKVISTLNVPQKLKDKMWYAYDQVVNGKNTELNQSFKALETTEYVLTAMNVYKNCRRLEAQGKPGLALEDALVGRVLVINLAKVLDVYVPLYPNSIGLFFKTNSSLIDKMIEHSSSWLNSNNKWMDKEVNHKELLEKFNIKWEAFKAQA